MAMAIFLKVNRMVHGKIFIFANILDVKENRLGNFTFGSPTFSAYFLHHASEFFFHL